ncbi:MAG: hypothetical protein SFV52_15775 [Saprospiraceae bacterium]|nr:hypothetical protein [Saprospiraceae bacterium]
MKRLKHDPLEDRAWAALRTRLDQEMPEKPRRRLAVWWWLPAVGIGLSVVGIGLSVVGSRLSVVGSRLSVVGGGLSVVGSGVSVVGGGRSDVGSGVSVVGSGLSVVGSGRSDVGSGRSDVGGGRSVVGSRRSDVGSGLSDVGGGVLVVRGGEKARGQELGQESLRALVESETVVGAGNQHQQKHPTMLAALPHVEPAIVCEQAVAPQVGTAGESHAVIRPHRSAHRVWSPLLGVQTGWCDVPRPDEVGLWAGVDWQPRGASFGMRTGLAYRYANAKTAPPSIVVLEDQSRIPDYLESADTQLPGSTNSIAPGSALLEVPVTHRHILEAPIQVFWQPRPGFRVYAGVAPGYVVGVQTGDVGRYNQEKIVRLNRSASLRRQVLAEESRWLAPGLFGAGFRWGGRWEATAMWRTSGSAHVGLQYRLGPR